MAPQAMMTNMAGQTDGVSTGTAVWTAGTAMLKWVVKDAMIVPPTSNAMATKSCQALM